MYLIISNKHVVHKTPEKPTDEQLFRWATYYHPYTVTLAEVVSRVGYGKRQESEETSLEKIVCGR